MSDYVSSLSDLNLIILIIGAFSAAVQVFLLAGMAIRGRAITLWYGWFAIAIAVYLILVTR